MIDTPRPRWSRIRCSIDDTPEHRGILLVSLGNVAVIAASVFAASAGSLARAEVFCNATPQSIPDGAGSLTMTILVTDAPGGSAITSVRVSVAATHPWVGDLHMVLRHPSGAEAILLDQPGIPSIGFPGPWGCGGHDLDVTFDDAATFDGESSCETVGIAIAGARRPVQSLAVFQGLAPDGLWSLEITDAVAIDAGSVGTICLDILWSPISECPADLDGSGSVDGADLAVVLGAWGATCSDCSADLTDDGAIDGADLAVLLGSWGACPD
jgi:hypothetical protein